MNHRTIAQIIAHRRRLTLAVDLQSLLIVLLTLAVSGLLLRLAPEWPSLAVVTFLGIMILALWIRVRAEERE